MGKLISSDLVDALTGTAIKDGNGRTVAFSFDGIDYEIDLSNENVLALTEAFSAYTKAGRKINHRPLRSKIRIASKGGRLE
ncbi:Lsr2 dimerization domain-containing protein [Curtobacterium flaccumfaciens]|uniref:Lsr2 dimerization domain-containing protein n=1 Tax=Curtobacterium flaccumfaciens TaxID=2035 RepID=UPI001BDE71C6|nr:histone-like nucleoid-structuring protein Lsr2 [Curtobacterium flaccumfaciens]MBT1608615.1 Lsr2 family protein [Curtobacterium flaccumfaciens pv. betae]MBT1658494.1 Lsr2 family protein [Curtobacterium flaccumfaciens pv. betae]MCS0472875.1 Lsr2 family protein [Curtobacterium flaccumfaciens pv. betae]MCS0476278.1 Lsr2 family protein [Curtobacterium flaccumfaciens pv. betae]MCS0479724.1 Lsr2 family protein [Curtobacterium flaccumfaciens pv. betae]